jgi:uncharacterized protein (DUF1015 family)
MLQNSALAQTVRKTFNIKSEYIEQIEKIVPSRKVTDFVNKALKHELALEKENKDREDALKAMSSLKKIRTARKKSIKSSEDVLREMRDSEISDKHQLSLN